MEASTFKNMQVKQGVPTNEELERLSLQLQEKWKELGRGLGIGEATLTAFDFGHMNKLDKIYNMLEHWKRSNGSAATYTVLYDALCHQFVNRTDLAEGLLENSILPQFIPGGSTEHLPRPKMKRCNEESSPSDASTTKKRETRLAVKQGVPSDEDLEWLSRELEDWEDLGHRLNIKEGTLTAIDKDYGKTRQKIFKMLRHWKARDGLDATYTVLHDALCHPLVCRRDLAEEFCCQKNSIDS